MPLDCTHVYISKTKAEIVSQLPQRSRITAKIELFVFFRKSCLFSFLSPQILNKYFYYSSLNIFLPNCTYFDIPMDLSYLPVSSFYFFSLPVVLFKILQIPVSQSLGGKDDQIWTYFIHRNEIRNMTEVSSRSHADICIAQ